MLEAKAIPRKTLDGQLLIQLFKMNDKIFLEYRKSKILKQENSSRFTSLLRKRTIEKLHCQDIVCKSAEQHPNPQRKLRKYRGNECRTSMTHQSTQQQNTDQRNMITNSDILEEQKQATRSQVNSQGSQRKHNPEKPDLEGKGCGVAPFERGHGKQQLLNNEQGVDYTSRLLKSERLKRRVSLPMACKLDRFLQPQSINANLLALQRLGDYSSESICIMRGNARIYESEGSKRREIASLTKILTCLCSLYMSDKYRISLLETTQITRYSCNLEGTSARLKQADVISLQDLLYAMMLPSGNDAAQALAQYFGRVEYRHSQQFKQRVQMTSASQAQKEKQLYISSFDAVDKFMVQMNRLAQHLHLNDTALANPHGLSNPKSKSTANDVALLCYYAMKNNRFKQIVNTREHSVTIFNRNTKMNRCEVWENTNKLLDLPECEGIKTGVTPSAGPCMSSYFHNEIIVVILKAKSKSSRFQEVQRLYHWVNQQ